MSEENRKYKVLKSEYLIQRPWLTARKDCVELPNGHINPEYYVLEYPDWVNVIAITTDGRFIMERQYRHAAGSINYELPCGVMEKGETPEQAARRELQEETGFGGGTWKKLMTISANPSTTTNMIHCFLATGVKKISEQHLDDTESLTVHFLSRNEVKNLLLNNELIQALMIAPLFKYFYEEEGK